MGTLTRAKLSVLAPRSFHDETQHVKLDPHVFHPQAELASALCSVSQQAVAQLRERAPAIPLQPLKQN